MNSRFRPLWALLPAGAVPGYLVVTSRRQVAGCGDAAGAPEGEPETSLSTRLASQLEAWLVPSDGTESLGRMVKDLHDAVNEDIQISVDEGKHLPLNFLMVKAMHDRELLASMTRTRKTAARNRSRADLSPRDQRTLRKSVRYARFAAASYDGVGDTVKEILAEEDAVRPRDLFGKSSDYLRKWCVGKRTGVDPDDVKELATSDSLETRTYFVAVDHSSRSVVVSIRGTYSFTDTMVDLLCNPVDFAGGKAHQGISKSAVRVWMAVQDQVEKQLREHSDYKLVLTGHSLGAGTAILLKILLANNATEALRVGARGKRRETVTLAKASRLDVGRPVRVECYAFAPPPVFSAPGAAWMRDVYSFVNGADCVPTMSLGSLYSLWRTIQNVDQLPLDVFKRAEFVLDSRVRVQQGEQGLGVEESIDDRRRVAEHILRLRRHPSLAFLTGDGYDVTDDDEDEDGEEEEEEDEHTKDAIEDVLEEEEEDQAKGEDGGGDDSGTKVQVIRSPISKFGEDWARFTQDVGEAADSLRATVNKAVISAGTLYEDVGRVTDRVSSMSSDEVALTLLLLKQLAAGGGPSPDEVLAMVQMCEKDGTRLRKEMSRSSETMTVGDLIIPGSVFLLDGWDAASGSAGRGSNNTSGGGGGGSGGSAMTVRRTSSEELGGIRLNSRMMADHSMSAYEHAVAAAAQRYRKKRAKPGAQRG